MLFLAKVSLCLSKTAVGSVSIHYLGCGKNFLIPPCVTELIMDWKDVTEKYVEMTHCKAAAVSNTNDQKKNKRRSRGGFCLGALAGVEWNWIELLFEETDRTNLVQA